MARRKSTTESAQFRAQAQKALAGQAAAVEDIRAVPSAPTPDEIYRAVEHCFGRSPKQVVGPLHRAVEAFNWLGALFQCIEDANNSDDRAQSATLIQALSSLGAYIAADYQVSIIGEPADEMQARIEAAQVGGAA